MRIQASDVGALVVGGGLLVFGLTRTPLPVHHITTRIGTTVYQSFDVDSISYTTVTSSNGPRLDTMWGTYSVIMYDGVSIWRTNVFR
jgi:hypothetical protein